MPTRASDVHDSVRRGYAASARASLTNADDAVRAVSQAFGYSPEELATLPAESNMGLSCGNPTAVANLRPGEVVVDLGSGGGLDVFLAATKVGPAGKAIGIDMTPEMIDRARRGAEMYPNVEFHLARIDDLPLSDASADCVISNCVINLAPDKAKVLAEVFRVLKPGGRVAVSDIALKRPLPDDLSTSVEAYVGCISGAIPVDDYARLLTDAGFVGVQVVDAGVDLNAYGMIEGQSACCSPEPAAETGNSRLAVATSGCCGSGTSTAVHDGLTGVLDRYDLNEFAASVKVFAVKPV